MTNNLTPKLQHKAQADKIMAKRKRSGTTSASIEDENFDDLDKTELRDLCKLRGIEYRKRDTVIELIKLLS